MPAGKRSEIEHCDETAFSKGRKVGEHAQKEEDAEAKKKAASRGAGETGASNPDPQREREQQGCKENGDLRVG